MVFVPGVWENGIFIVFDPVSILMSTSYKSYVATKLKGNTSFYSTIDLPTLSKDVYWIFFELIEKIQINIHHIYFC